MALRTRVDEISEIGRSTQGVRLMNLRRDDNIASIALLDYGRHVERQQALEAENATLAALAPDFNEASEGAYSADGLEYEGLAFDEIDELSMYDEEISIEDEERYDIDEEE
ncbi:MAG: hypothetical protein IT326_09825, partial [Anaerolineae bacterium]|nr:hypothetical protein [Anaerolineae bacterium]